MIGVFDSGSGGLTVLKEIRARLPRADVVYFGDLRNAPYGEKTPEELGILTVLGLKKLVEEGATQIVSACNSASANIVVPLFKELKIKPEEIIEMVGPTVKAFKDRREERILLVGTMATIRSGIYQDAFRPLGIELQTLPLIHLAHAIEENTSEPAILAMIGNSLEKYNGSYDTLILACTHFPLVIDVFRRCVPKSVTNFDPAAAVAEEVASKYKNNRKDLFSNSRELENRENGGIRFLISKDSDFFRQKIQEFFGNEDYTIDVIS